MPNRCTALSGKVVYQLTEWTGKVVYFPLLQRELTVLLPAVLKPEDRFRISDGQSADTGFANDRVN